MRAPTPPSVSFRSRRRRRGRAVLNRVPIFGALTDAERKEVAGHIRPCRFARDEVVFHRDDPASHLYVIASGSVRVSIPDDEGHQIVVAIERDGAVFGELASSTTPPRSATVTALDETQVVTISRDDFLRVKCI